MLSSVLKILIPNKQVKATQDDSVNKFKVHTYEEFERTSKNGGWWKADSAPTCQRSFSLLLNRDTGPLGVADVASRVHINTSGCLLRGNITKVQGKHEEFERTSKNFGKLTML